MAALRSILLALAVSVFGLLGWRTAAGPVVPVARPLPLPAGLATLDAAMRGTPEPVLAPLSAPSTPRTVSAPERSGEAPEFAGFYGRLKVDFPHDYSIILARSGRDGAPPPTDIAVWDALRDIEQSQGVLAAGAEPGVLDRFFDARSAVLDRLAPLDARRCVDFLYGLTDAALAEFTAAHRGLVATLADRTLDAIADGRGHHVDRAVPTAADLDALSTGLAAFGLTPAEIGLLIDGTTPDSSPSDRRLCEIGRTYLDVLHGLPADARGRIYGLAAELLFRS